MDRKKNKRSANLSEPLVFFGVVAAAALVFAIYHIAKEDITEKNITSKEQDTSKMSIEELKQAMEQCIIPGVENYEEAAKIRDIINFKKSQISSS